MELEEHIVPVARHAEAPVEARKVFDENQIDRVPTAIGHHPEHGWFVLETTGQGPYVVWPEEGL